MREDILTQISIDVINNSGLTWGAKGLYLFMKYGFVPCEELTRERLIEISKTGKFSTVSALRELMAYGFVKKCVKRKAKERFEKFYYQVR